MELKSRIMDAEAVNRATVRIAHEILEHNRGTENVVLVGILRRGVPMAKAIARSIARIENVEVPFGQLDITLYRDDLTPLSDDPQVKQTGLPFSVTGKKVILVDDVLFTGRTLRAAIDALFSLGRPAQVQVAVMVDRGHRELPFRPDYVGRNLPTSHTELVVVKMPPYDDEVCVELYSV